MFGTVYPPPIPAPAPYVNWPIPSPPSVRSVAYPPLAVPMPSAATRYKTAVSPQYTPPSFATAYRVRNGSGTKNL